MPPSRRSRGGSASAADRSRTTRWPAPASCAASGCGGPRRTRSPQIEAPLPSVERLPRPRALQVIACARAALAARCREVNAMTYPNADEVWWCDLGEGVALAVIGIAREHRLALETNTGYLLLANGVPIGYGGVTPLFRQANTGINIFDPVPRRRGGVPVDADAARVPHAVRQHALRHQPVPVRRRQRRGDQERRVLVLLPPGLSAGGRGTRDAGRARGASAWRRTAATEATRARCAHWRRATSASTCRRTMRRTTSTKRSSRRPAHARRGSWREWPRFRAAIAQSYLASEVARELSLDDPAHWPAEERRGFEGLAPIFAHLPGMTEWPRADREALAAMLRAKGLPQERSFALRATRAPRAFHALREALRAGR